MAKWMMRSLLVGTVAFRADAGAEFLAKASVELPENPPFPRPTTHTSVSPIITRGNFLYDSVTGQRFFSKGVAYNPRSEKYDKSFGPSVQVKGWVDRCEGGDAKPLSYTQDTQVDSLEEVWSVDLEAIANMGANTVRLYNIDPATSHRKFMEKAASLGIYAVVPLNGKDWGFLPAISSPDCYTQDIEGYGNVGVNALSFAKQVVKEFSQYNNTLMFTVNNELPQNDKNGWSAFPCVKALTRDVHRYQAQCSSTMRKVPLIYTDVDVGGSTPREIADYLSCPLESEDDAIDAYGLNVYSWCEEVYPGDGKADNFQYSPYYHVKQEFEDLPIPFLFSEFGCNLGDFKTKCPYKGGRSWSAVKHMLGADMDDFLSGCVAFQWSMDKEEFGLTLSPGFLKGQDQLYLLDTYYSLQKIYKNYNVSSKWDARPIEVDSCSFKPSEVVQLAVKSKQPRCPDKAMWTKLQKEKGVDRPSDWSVLPPAADAPLSHVDQAECPTEALSLQAMKLNCESQKNSTTAHVRGTGTAAVPSWCSYLPAVSQAHVTACGGTSSSAGTGGAPPAWCADIPAEYQGTVADCLASATPAPEASLAAPAAEVASECSSHPACTQLALTGSCCPTVEGDMLGCCAAAAEATQAASLSNAGSAPTPEVEQLNLKASSVPSSSVDDLCEKVECPECSDGDCVDRFSRDWMHIPYDSKSKWDAGLQGHCVHAFSHGGLRSDCRLLREHDDYHSCQIVAGELKCS